MTKLRVLIVDDHPVMRNGLKNLVEAEQDMEVIGEAFEGEAAVRQTIELRPDVVVMDVSMPGMSGTEATALIHMSCPDTRVVALTAHEDRGYLRQMMGAGASAFVLKRSAATDVVGAVRCAAAGDIYLDPALPADQVTASEQLASDDSLELSERETEVLQRIAQGYSNKQIAARLNISVKTVETYKARAMEKLGAKSRVDIVKFAADRGWLTTG